MTIPTSGSDKAGYVGLAALSAGMLTYEINLTRLYAVQQFHHFGFLVVSLAVMGLGASGLALSLWRRPPSRSRLASAYALSIAAAYLISNRIPFDSYSIAWDRRQAFILILYFLAAALPFFLGGLVAGASLAEAGEAAHLPYAAVFIGSGLGCPLALVAHANGGSLTGMTVALALGWLAAASFAVGAVSRGILVVLAIASLSLRALQAPSLDVQFSPYKALSVSRLAADARHALTRWDWASRVDVVETGSLHAYPGLSLNATVMLPPQSGLFLDGDGPLPITLLDPDQPEAFAFAAAMPSRLPYQLRPGARALVLDPGAGLPAQLALASGAREVSIPSDQPLVVNVLAGPYARQSSYLLQNPRLTLLHRAGRGSLRAGEGRYDIIEFPLSDPFRPLTSGAFSLTESYLLTVEAVADAYARLKPDGLLVLTRWLGTPPSEAARAWSMVVAALTEQGVQDPANQLLAYRSMRTATIVASPSSFTAGELADTRQFLEANGYDPIYLPDLKPAEVNRYNRLPEPVYEELFAALLADPEAATRSHAFQLDPPTDSQPYFFHFFRWRQTPDVLATLGLTWQPFGGSGYFVLIALLALAVVLAAPLVVLPLLVRRGADRPRPGGAALAYFASLGAGYLLVEIPLIQRLTLLLDHPAIALATVLFTLLLASGVGSLLSTRIELGQALAALVIFVALLAAVLPAAVRWALPWDLWARLALTVGLLTPAGLLMGIPFASGLRRLERRLPGMIPWAWAVNGAISGVSGVAAAILALDWGFTVVLIAGGLAYAGAFLAAPRLAAGEETGQLA